MKKRILREFSRSGSKRVRLYLWTIASAFVFAFIFQEGAHALILNAARAALTADLTAAGFADVGVVGLFFGLLEFIMIAIPVGAGAIALSRMERGTEAWLPWVQIMGGSLIFIAFVVVLVNQIYGGAGAAAT